jgi:hypothetical protein
MLRYCRTIEHDIWLEVDVEAIPIGVTASSTLRRGDDDSLSSEEGRTHSETIVRLHNANTGPESGELACIGERLRATPVAPSQSRTTRVQRGLNVPQTRWQASEWLIDRPTTCTDCFGQLEYT